MFLTRRSASDPGDRSPWGNFWFEPTGLRSMSGVRVTAGSAMRLSAVYSCVRVLAETFAVLPFKLYRPKDGGGRDLVTDHWLYRLMASSPNQWQTPFEWREMMMGHLCLRGRCHNQIVPDGRGGIDSLVPLHPDRMTYVPLASGSYRWDHKNDDGSTTPMTRFEVFTVNGLASDGYTGLNPMQVQAEVLGLGLAAQGYGARFFANDAKPGGWIEMPPGGKFADDAARKTFKAEWASAQGGANRGKTAILDGGMKYHELAVNNADAQFLESRKFSRSEIAAMFRVPPHLIGDLEKATFSNIEQQSLDFVIHTMTPWAERWEAAIESWLMLADEQLDVEFDFTNLLRGDRAARVTYYQNGIQSGWLTRNEARLAEGYNPLPGLDKPMEPLNMTPAGTQPAKAPSPAAPDDTGEEGAGARAVVIASIVQAASERVARKELQLIKAALRGSDPKGGVKQAYIELAPFVQACMGLSTARAEAYCEARATAPIDERMTEEDFVSTAACQLANFALLKGTL